jgi:hypothetical protein
MPMPTKINRETEPLFPYLQAIQDEAYPFRILCTSAKRAKYMRDRLYHLIGIMKKELQELEIDFAPPVVCINPETHTISVTKRGENSEENLHSMKNCQGQTLEIKKTLEGDKFEGWEGDKVINPPPKPLIYLATPYSHPDPAVRQQRYDQAKCITVELLEDGHLVISPIVHSHYLTIDIGEHLAFTEVYGFNNWSELDLRILSMCDKLVVVKMDGWNESKGIIAEVEEAKRLGIPVEFIGKALTHE